MKYTGDDIGEILDLLIKIGGDEVKEKTVLEVAKLVVLNNIANELNSILCEIKK